MSFCQKNPPSILKTAAAENEVEESCETEPIPERLEPLNQNSDVKDAELVLQHRGKLHSLVINLHHHMFLSHITP